MKNKKATADQIIDNLNARIALLKAQNAHRRHWDQLQEMLDDICRHSMGIESIEVSTQQHKNSVEFYQNK